MNKHIIKPWTIIIIDCLLTALLLILNEIFANGSENAISIINVLFLILIIVAVIRSFGSNFSQFYKISVWMFAIPVFLIAYYGLSMKLLLEHSSQDSQSLSTEGAIRKLKINQNEK